MLTYVVVITATIAALLFFLIDNDEEKKTTALPDYCRSPLFNGTEERVLRELMRIVDNNAIVLSKVRLADVIESKSGNRKGFFHISQKHIDFIIYDIKTRRVRCAIEIDGPSHSNPEQQKSDNVKNHALRTAGIPLHRITSDRWKDPQKLRSICNANAGTNSSSDDEDTNNIASPFS